MKFCFFQITIKINLYSELFKKTMFMCRRPVRGIRPVRGNWGFLREEEEEKWREGEVEDFGAQMGLLIDKNK